MERRFSLRQAAIRVCEKYFPSTKPTGRLSDDCASVFYSNPIFELALDRHFERNDLFSNQDPDVVEEEWEDIDQHVDQWHINQPIGHHVDRHIDQYADQHIDDQGIQIASPCRTSKPLMPSKVWMKPQGEKRKKGRRSDISNITDDGGHRKDKKGKKEEYRPKPRPAPSYSQANVLRPMAPANCRSPGRLASPKKPELTKKQLRDRRHRLGRKWRMELKHRETDLHTAQSGRGFDNAYKDGRISSTAWQGNNPTEDRKWIMECLKNGEDLNREFVPIYYTPGKNAAVADSNGAVVFYRSVVATAIQNILPIVLTAAQDFIKQTTVADPEPNHSRGTHWYCMAGIDRNSKTRPAFSKWHRQNKSVLDEFFQPGNPLHMLTEYGCGILKRVFPAIAKRYKDCSEYLEEKYNMPAPYGGHFYNFCLNGPKGDIRRVHCDPHVDYKNIALGVCMIFVYGHFNHREKCWLAIWEAGVAFELPPGVFLFYPSSLFLHFNADLKDLTFVTTPDGSKPTPKNSRPLYCCGKPEAGTHDKNWEEAIGRGSMVWYNQASVFQYSELEQETG
ncbi:hypothetical protein PM082_023298 [Marasmius tenuissimus]|nr:hypothetical protein PM082_023298 [Marasmius tenuissimus]